MTRLIPALLLLPSLACTPTNEGGTRTSVGDFGAPLPGLTAAERRLFEVGALEFAEVEDHDEGLGPMFNGTSCAQCHSLPVIGGGGHAMVMRAGLLSTSGVFQEPPGGSLIVMFSTRPERVRWVVPAEVNVVAFRRSPPLLGFGLLEAIPDATLEALAAQSGKPAGVLGRVGHVTDAVSQQTRAGRFGWKAQHATLRAFAGDAYRSEMGITNEVFPEELAPNGDLAALALVDYVADPESEFGAVSKLTDFMRLLDAPARGPIGASEVAGELLFTQAGCASCHVPSITTGPSEIAALSFREARLFSDLLLHDVGTGDGIAQADASPSEMRTMPLWGLRHRTPYLHDGRAATIDAAIRLHAGEAAGVTAAYAALSVAERDQLVTFLRSL